MRIFIANLVLDARTLLGEGPVWAPDSQLYFVDILDKKIHSFNPKTKKHYVFKVPQQVGCVVPARDGKLLVALENEFGYLDPLTGKYKRELKINYGKGMRTNDGKCDRHGWPWIGVMAQNAQKCAGRLLRFEPIRSSDPSERMKMVGMISGLTIPNGLAWSKKGDTFYHVDTPTRQVVAYNFDDDMGTISNPRVVVQVEEGDGNPDGMTIDQEGHLWVGMWGTGKVNCYSPRSGKKLAEVKVPGVTNVTSCTFGGEEFKTLYITTARDGLSEKELENQPHAGDIFAITMEGIHGYAPHTYAG